MINLKQTVVDITSLFETHKNFEMLSVCCFDFTKFGISSINLRNYNIIYMIDKNTSTIDQTVRTSYNYGVINVLILDKIAHSGTILNMPMAEMLKNIIKDMD